MKSDKEIINRLRVVKPCTQDWGQMIGERNIRFCDSCNKNVYNISNLNAREIKRLIVEKKQSLCVSYICDDNGSIIYQKEKGIIPTLISNRYFQTATLTLLGFLATSAPTFAKTLNNKFANIKKIYAINNTQQQHNSSQQQNDAQQQHRPDINKDVKFLPMVPVIAPQYQQKSDQQSTQQDNSSQQNNNSQQNSNAQQKDHTQKHTLPNIESESTIIPLVPFKPLIFPSCQQNNNQQGFFGSDLNFSGYGARSNGSPIIDGIDIDGIDIDEIDTDETDTVSDKIVSKIEKLLNKIVNILAKHK